MATFPALQPATRTFTPGRHPHSEIPTLSGLQTRVRTSNVLLDQRLRLTFAALTEAEMLSIRSHYLGQQGRFLSFAIPNELLSGTTSPASFTPTGYSWVYASRPTVTDIGLQRYDVSVELATVPPEGATLNGAEFTVAASIIAGSVSITADVAGANLIVTASIEGGLVADNESAGLDIPVPISLVAGTATGGGLTLPNIGDAYEGGFYAGLISHTADGVATHALIVAPRATGASGANYTPLNTSYAWKTTLTTTAGTTSSFDGAANTAAMVTAGIANHPAANFCVGLSIGGYSDWYLPARYELDIAYENLKPTTASNNTSWGINPYSVPARTVNRAAGGPPTQTSVTAFQVGGAQPFTNDSHKSSTENTSSDGWNVVFGDGRHFGGLKTTALAVRAFRRVAL